MTAKMWPLLPSLLAIVPLFFGTSLWAVNKYYGEPSIRCCKACTERDFLILPTPVGQVARLTASSNEDAQHLSETIGYRTIGTKEHAEGDAWMVEQVQQLKKDTTAFEDISPFPSFDIMDYRVYENYVSLYNIIVRLSNGIAAGKEHALVNSHIDSTTPSPGGADDALLVTLSNYKAIRIVCFYSAFTIFTAKSEPPLAAGTRGPERLFQATPNEMVMAYSKILGPYGTILANDIVSSGIIMSEYIFIFLKCERILNFLHYRH
ncbi:hypothetical protein M422DRAFT_48503 [Sphaerobolus stellatus SS14]|uniref:Peptide hydrolase n=1 Tax=Sphaerobolus stellatus (strain SS14) TaxID=990650 RepID=A0A0C9VTH1_SPHS4|nr:hypothetical protein M422DRAFT_48503 [Sphaerobolus stellatus SS14]